MLTSTQFFIFLLLREKVKSPKYTKEAIKMNICKGKRFEQVYQQQQNKIKKTKKEFKVNFVARFSILNK